MAPEPRKETAAELQLQLDEIIGKMDDKQRTYYRLVTAKSKSEGLATEDYLRVKLVFANGIQTNQHLESDWTGRTDRSAKPHRGGIGD